MILQTAWQTLKDTVDAWIADKAPKMAAALAYFTVLSLAPLLVIVLKLLSVKYSGPDAAQHLHDQLASLTDPAVANAMRDLIPSKNKAGTGLVAALLSAAVALFGASGVFAELQDSLNIIWEVRPKPGRSFWFIVRDRFLSISMVLGIAFLLLVSMVLSSVLTGASHWIVSNFFGSGHSTRTIGLVVTFSVDILFSTAVITVLFAAMFRILPDAEIKWRDVWLGAAATAVLFQIGKYGLSLYIGLAKPGVAYGIAGSIVVLLIWVYYSSWILFFGAEFTRVYANKFGSRIVPSPNAEPLTKEMREQAGIVKPHPASG